MADWKSFLPTVDDEATDPEVLKQTEEFFLKAKFQNPQSAAGTTVAKLENHGAYPGELPTQAFISRAVDTLTAIAAARRAAKDISGASGAPSVPALSSALSVASLLAPPKTVDVNAMLKSVGLEKLGYNLQLDQAMADKLANETELAKKLGRRPFTYVDLTGRETLPLWLAPESVGGRAEDEFMDLEAASSIDSLQKLGQALKGATDAKRFFGAIHQWSAAFMRYAPFAIAAGHLEWTAVLAHLNCVYKLVEEERCDGRGPQLAILYDELLRRQLERRAQKGDPTLDVEAMMSEPDKSVLAAARQRLDSVLKAANRTKAADSGSGASRALAYSHRDQALAAAKALGEQQAERVAAGGAAARGSSSDGGRRKKEKKQLSKRDEKKRQWIQDKRSWGGGKRHHR